MLLYRSHLTCCQPSLSHNLNLDFRVYTNLTKIVWAFNFFLVCPGIDTPPTSEEGSNYAIQNVQRQRGMTIRQKLTFGKAR